MSLWRRPERFVSRLQRETNTRCVRLLHITNLTRHSVLLDERLLPLSRLGLDLLTRGFGSPSDTPAVSVIWCKWWVKDVRTGTRSSVSWVGVGRNQCS